MTPWELGVASLLYVSVAYRYGAADNYGMAVVFAAYAVANVGFMFAKS
jgi:hypothetical protein